jgi:K+-sensing histidine kinase KdpD
MGFARGAVPGAATFAIFAAMTALLVDFKIALSVQHLVYFYLLPTAIVAFFWGSFAALFSAVLAIMCSCYLLYDPVWSFYVADRLQVGEIVSFGVLAILSSKCTAMLRPDGRNPATKFSIRRL